MIDIANNITIIQAMKTKQQIIEANNKCLAFKGSPKQAIDFVDYMSEFASETGGEYINLVTDFLYNIEVELQNNGYLDEDFNPTDKCLN